MYWLPSKDGSMGRVKVRVILQWQNPTNTISARWPRSTSTVISHVVVHIIGIYIKWNTSPLQSSSRNACNPNIIMRKTSDKCQLRDILQISDQYFSKLSKSSKPREVWENVIAKRTWGFLQKEERIWEFNIMWNPGWYSGTEKRHWVKSREIGIK